LQAACGAGSTKYLPLGAKQTVLTGPKWPSSTCRHLPVSLSTIAHNQLSNSNNF
jgi:hypothetical protein